MNKIYKVVWNAARNCYVVCSEIVTTKGKTKSRHGRGHLTRSKTLLAVMACSGLLAWGGLGVNVAFADEPAHANTWDHQYVVLSAGGNLNSELNTSWIYITNDNRIAYKTASNASGNAYANVSKTANGTVTDATDSNGVPYKSISGGDTVYLRNSDGTYTQYRFTAQRDGGVYTLTNVNDSSDTVTVYKYGKQTLRDYTGAVANTASNGQNGYRVREDYAVTASQGTKYTPVSNTDNVFTVTYTGNVAEKPTDILTKITSVDSLTGTQTNLNEQLQTITADQYTSQATGGAQVGGSWDYVLVDPNSSTGYTNVKGSSMPKGFVTTGPDSALVWNDTTQQYEYNGTPVATDNLYVVDGQLGVFTQSTTNGKSTTTSVYTGPVYGSGNEILLTSLQNGTYYSFWGAPSNDTTQTMSTFPLAKYNQNMETLTNNDQKLAHNDINHVRVADSTTTNNAATISLYRNGTDMLGTENETNLVSGQVTVSATGGENGIANNSNNDRKLTISDGSQQSGHSRTLTTGSLVGNTHDISGNNLATTITNGTAQNLQSLTINGTTYGLQTKYVGDDSSTVTKNLGQTLSITGGATDADDLTTGNIGVINSGTSTNGALSVRLNKDVNLTSDGSLTVGNTTVNNTGVTVTTSTTDAAQNPSITTTGISGGSKQITNVASGGSASGSTNAANISDVHRLAKADIAVEAGKNLTKSQTLNGEVRTDTLALADDITLGSGNNAVRINGNNGTVTVGSTTNTTDGRKNSITLNGTTGTASLGDINAGSNVSSTEQNYTSSTYTKRGSATIDGETVDLESVNTTLLGGTTGETKTGTYITGLTNTDWDWRNLSIDSDRAATEAQVLKAGQHFFSVNSRNEDVDETTIPNYYNEGASGAASMAIGHGVSTAASADRSIAIGGHGTSTGTTTTNADGTTTSSGGSGALAVGYNATAKGNNTIAIGNTADAAGERSISIGNENSANGIRSIALGVNVQSGYTSTNADVSENSYASGKMEGGADIAIGNRTRVYGTGSTALGFGALVGETNADGSMKTGSSGTDLAVAIGGRSVVTADGGVALGNISVANRAAGSSGAYMSNHAVDADGNDISAAATAAKDIGSLRATYNTDGTITTNTLNDGDAWHSNMGAVSIGSDAARTAEGGDTVPVITRQLTGLAAGTADTDAVNVAQLRALASAGQNYQGDNYDGTSLATVHRDQGATLQIQGGANVDNTSGTVTATNTTGNIYVTANPTAGRLTVSLNDNPNVHTLTAGTAGNSGQTGTVSIVGNNGSDMVPNYVAYNITSGTDTAKADLNGNTDRLTYSDGTSTHTLATLDDGLKFKGDDASTTNTENHVVRTLADQELTITGGANTNNLSDNNIGVVANDSDTGLEVKLARDITGLNTIRVGTGSTNNGGIYIGYQPDGNNTATSNNYITGLENKTWDIGTTTAVSGRAATEDQLKNAADQIVTLTGSDTYATSANADYGTNGSGTLTINRETSTVNSAGTRTASPASALTTNIHDYYVTSGTVGDNNHLILTKNDNSTVDVDLSSLVTDDYSLVANPATGSSGQYTVDSSNGTMTLTVQNSKNTSQTRSIVLAGLSTNFGANVGSTGTTDNNSHAVNLGGTQNIVGSDTTAKTGATYSNGNIRTQLNSNGDIVINLNDDPTLKSLILQGENNSTITLDKGTGDNVNRLTYTVDDGTTTYNVATTNDGYTLRADTGSDLKAALNSIIKISGAATTGTITAADLATANNIGVTIATVDGVPTYTLQLNKNITGLTSVTAGGDDTTAVDMSANTTTGAVIGRQTNLTITTVADNGDKDTSQKETTAGDYVTGLDNKEWNVGQNHYISGRAATEDQLKSVSDTASNNSSRITNVESGWEAQVGGTKLKDVKYDANDTTSRQLNFAAGRNMSVSGDGSTITYATNANVGFTNVHVAGSGDGSSMTGGIEIGNITDSDKLTRKFTTVTQSVTTDNSGTTTVTFNPGTGVTTTTFAPSDGSNPTVTTQNPGDAGYSITAAATTDTAGKYILGLDNTSWTNGQIVSGRAATEDQLQSVAQQIRGEVSAADNYVTGGTATYSSTTDNLAGDGTGSAVLSLSGNAADATVTGLHDFYVVSGAVLPSTDSANTTGHSILRLTKNGAVTGASNTVDIDLSSLATTDWRLVPNPTTGSNGAYTVDSNGTMTLKMEDLNNPGTYTDVNLTGLTTYFGADNTSSATDTATGTTTWTNRITRNLGDKLDIKGNDTTAATDATYSNGNIRTTANATDGSITISLNDNPTLKSVILQGDDNTLVTLKKNGDRVSYQVNGGTAYNIANTSDGLSFKGNNDTTITKSLSDTTALTIKGDAATNDVANGSNVYVSGSTDNGGTLNIQLAKDISGFNTVTAGGGTGDDTSAVFGRQKNLTRTTVASDGTTSTSTDTTEGDYVTGLDNKSWTNGTYVSGRAATEDQLQAVASTLNQTISQGNKYVTKAAVTYADNGSATGTLTYNDNTSSGTESAITGVHDYYVNNASVDSSTNTVTLKLNNGQDATSFNLTSILPKDTRIGGAAVTTGEGESATTTYTGEYNIGDDGVLKLNIVNADGTPVTNADGSVKQIVVNGLAWKTTVDQGVNYGSDTGYDASANTWAANSTTNRALGGTIGILGGKTSTIGTGDNAKTYTHNNITTTRDANGNIVINLSDSPTLQSLKLTNTGDDSDTITITKGTGGNVDRLTVTPGTEGSTAQTVAYLSDGLNFTADTTVAGSTDKVVVNRSLGSTLAIIGDADTADEGHANIHVTADQTAGLNVNLDDNVHVTTLRAGKATGSNQADGSISIVGAGKTANTKQETVITAAYDAGHIPAARQEGDQDSITRLTYKNNSSADNPTHIVATLEDGYTWVGDIGNNAGVELSKTINFTGTASGGTKPTADQLAANSNIGVTISEDDSGAQYLLQLNKNITGLTTVTAGNAVLGTQTPSTSASGTGSTTQDVSGSYLTGLTNTTWTRATVNGTTSYGSVKNDDGSYSIVDNRAATEAQLKAAVDLLNQDIHNHESSTYGLTADDNSSVTRTLGNNITISGASTTLPSQAEVKMNRSGVNNTTEAKTETSKQNIKTSVANDELLLALNNQIALGNETSDDDAGRVDLYAKRKTEADGSSGNDNSRIHISAQDGISLRHTDGNDNTAEQLDGISITGPYDRHNAGVTRTYDAKGNLVSRAYNGTDYNTTVQLDADGNESSHTTDTQRANYGDSNGSFAITNNDGQFTARLSDIGATGYLGLGNTASTLHSNPDITDAEQIQSVTTTVTNADGTQRSSTQTGTNVARIAMYTHYGTASLNSAANVTEGVVSTTTNEDGSTTTVTNSAIGGRYQGKGAMTRLKYLDEEGFSDNGTTTRRASHEIATLDDGLVVAADMDGEYDTAAQATAAGETLQQRNLTLNKKLQFTGGSTNAEWSPANYGNVQVSVGSVHENGADQPATGTNVTLRLAKNMKGFNTIQLGGTESNTTSTTSSQTIRIGNLANGETTGDPVAVTASSYNNVRYAVNTTTGTMTDSGALYEAADANGNTYYTSDTSDSNLRKKYWTGSAWVASVSELPTDRQANPDRYSRNISISDALSTARTSGTDLSTLALYQVTDASGSTYYTTDSTAGGTAVTTNTLNPTYGRYMTGLSNTQWDGTHVDVDRAATEGQLRSLQQQIISYNETSGGFALSADKASTEGGSTSVTQNLGSAIAVKGDTNITTTADNDAKSITVSLNKNLDLGDSGSVKTGNTTINNSGVTIINGNTTVSLTDSGLNNGGNKITNVAAGTELTDAVNVSQLNQAVAGAANTVSAGKNIDVSSSRNTTGSTNYTVALQDQVTLGTKATAEVRDADGNVTRAATAGTAGKITVQSNALDSQAAVTANGETGMLTTTDSDGKNVTMGKQEAQAVIQNSAGTETNVAEKENGNYLMGLENRTWNPSENGIVHGRAATEDQLKSVADSINTTLNAGMNFSGDNNGTDNKPVNVKNDGTLKLNGGETDTSNLTATTDKNIGVVKNSAGDGLDIRLAKNLSGLESVTTGNTTIKNSGLTVKNENGGQTVVNGGGTTITSTTTDQAGNTYNTTTNYNGGGMTINTTVNTTGGQTLYAAPVQVSQTNVTMGGNQIHNIASGYTNEMYRGRNDQETRILNNAASIGDLEARSMQITNNLGGAINKLGNRVNKVGAGAAALAALHPLDFDPDAKWDFAAGYGHYKNANAAAVGAYYRPNEDTMFSIGGSMGGGENMFNAGVTFKLGTGANHVSTSRVAMAKEIKDLRAVVAKQDAEMTELRNTVNQLVAGRNVAPIEVKPVVSQAMPDGVPESAGELFPDVPKNHWAYEYVTKLAKAGMLKGYPDGEFKGNRMLTRYEFASALYYAIMNGAASKPELSQDGSLDRLSDEFSGELKYISIAVVKKDKDGNPLIERVRTVPQPKKA